jgi:hypothetical protein
MTPEGAAAWLPVVLDYVLIVGGALALLALLAAGELTPALLTAMLGTSGVGAIGRVRAAARQRWGGEEPPP